MGIISKRTSSRSHTYFPPSSISQPSDSGFASLHWDPVSASKSPFSNAHHQLFHPMFSLLPRKDVRGCRLADFTFRPSWVPTEPCYLKAGIIDGGCIPRGKDQVFLSILNTNPPTLGFMSARFISYVVCSILPPRPFSMSRYIHPRDWRLADFPI